MMTVVHCLGCGTQDASGQTLTLSLKTEKSVFINTETYINKHTEGYWFCDKCRDRILFEFGQFIKSQSKYDGFTGEKLPDKDKYPEYSNNKKWQIIVKYNYENDNKYSRQESVRFFNSKQEGLDYLDSLKALGYHRVNETTVDFKLSGNPCVREELVEC